MQKNYSKLFLAFIILFGLAFNLQAQKVTIDSLTKGINQDNIVVSKLYTDSLSSSFLIWVENHVKEHKHCKHTESIYVEGGEAIMTLENDTLIIKKGDFIVIPFNTYHSVIKVLSAEPLKVLSIQSPEFLGDDRVFKN